MIKYRAHLIFFLICISYILLGVFINSGEIAYSIGAILASMTDPFLFIGAIIIGIKIKKQKIFISTSILLSLILTILIYFEFKYFKFRYIDIDISILYFLYKLVATLFIAYFINLFTIYFYYKYPIVENINLPKKEFNIGFFYKKFRNHFKKEILFRIFIVLEILAIFFFIYNNIFMHKYSWDISYIFKEYHWNNENENWIFLLTIIAPYLIVKAISWIQDTKINKG